VKYQTDSGFEKELKNLTKKFGSLPEDFESLKKFSIEFFHTFGAENNGSIFIKWQDENICNCRLINVHFASNFIVLFRQLK
jgi:hypothetical protein